MSRVCMVIDGVEREVAAGQDLLSAALGLDIAIPHFCWHAALGSVGACRLCAVRVQTGPDDPGRIEMACMTPVADGLRVASADPEAASLRARVIEWLMANHPHDCAVCPEGGSCHLQDMVVASGHHARRFRFPKRTQKGQDLGPLLTHEPNRCIACYRCTRFYRGYAGGRDLDVFGAHDRVFFGRYRDGALESPFAGNLAEVCPTGVFNDRGWSADYARKWDMAATPSICGGCSLGCNTIAAERGGRLRRIQNRFHGAINGHFLCDRGRFALPGAGLEAMVNGAPVPVAEALAAARAALAGGAIGIGSPRATVETNFALRALVGPGRFFAGVSGPEAATVARMAALLPDRPASLRDLEAADAMLVLGEDLTGTAPRAALAVRQMVRGASVALAAEKGVPGWLDNAVRVAGEGRRSPLALVTPLPDALDDVATWALRRTPDGVAAFGHAVAAALAGAPAEPAAQAVAAALAAARAPAVVAGFGLGRSDAVEAAAAVARALGDRARLALFPPEGGSMGLALLTDRGLGAAAEALAAGPRTVVIAEADLFERADPALADRLLAAGTVIVLDAIPTRTTARATIVLPVAGWAEAAGTLVNHERRAQRLFAAIPGGRPAAWRVLAGLIDPAPDWPDLDALQGAIAGPLAGIRDAAPGAATRTPMGRFARAPWRMSGRTAPDLAGRLAEGTPPRDPDSALAFGMEGAQGLEAPPALRTALTVPGWHSAAAVWAGVDLATGTLRDGDPGAILPAPGVPAMPRPEPQGAGLIPIPLHDPFAGDERARLSPLLAARCPAPVIALNPADAASLGLSAGDPVTLGTATAPLTLDPAIPPGHVGASAGRILPRGLTRRLRVERA